MGSALTLCVCVCVFPFGGGAAAAAAAAAAADHIGAGVGRNFSDFSFQPTEFVLDCTQAWTCRWFCHGSPAAARNCQSNAGLLLPATSDCNLQPAHFCQAAEQTLIHFIALQMEKQCPLCKTTRLKHVAYVVSCAGTRANLPAQASGLPRQSVRMKGPTNDLRTPAGIIVGIPSKSSLRSFKRSLAGISGIGDALGGG